MTAHKLKWITFPIVMLALSATFLFLSPADSATLEQVNTTSKQTLINKTLTAPVLSGTITGTYTLGGTPTITGATLTSPAISSPTFSGTAIGTSTLAGTPTLTAPAISNPTLSGGGVLGGTYTGTYTLGGTPTGSLVQALATGSTTARSLAERFTDVVNVKDFGAVGDGVTDDLTPLTNFINAVLASESRTGVMGAKTYAISAALPNINVSGVRILGAGPDFGHIVAPLAVATVIKKIGAASGTMLTVAPTEGAGDQALTGIALKGLTFEGNSLADKCVVIKSIHRSEIDITCREATVTGLELNVATTLGDVADAQFNSIRYHGWQTTSAGVSLRLIGTATANWSLNTFEQVDIVHKNAIGIIEENADNNVWGMVRVFQAAGGSAVNSIEWRGGATSAQSCRNEHFLQLTATLAAIAKGTGTYTVGTQAITAQLDKGNSTPNITVEAGATAFDDSWQQTTPTPTSQTGAFTTVSAVVRVLRAIANPPSRVYIQGSVTITNAGTAAGFIRVPLPITVSAGSQGAVFAIKETALTGVAGVGFALANGATLDILKYDGTTLIATGNIIQFSGMVEQ